MLRIGVVLVASVACGGDREPSVVPGEPPKPIEPASMPVAKVNPCAEIELVKRGKLTRPDLLACTIKGIDQHHLDNSKLGDAFEITTRERLAEVARCEDPSVDWKTQRVWVLLASGISVTQSVLQVDDGKTLTLLVRTSNRAGCGGIKTGMVFASSTVRVPADRKVEIQRCPEPNHCTGREK